MSYRLGSNLGLQLARVNKQFLHPIAAQSFKRTAATTLQSLRQEELQEQENHQLSRQMTRQWKAGDVYAPHDLSGAAASKWTKRHRPTTDAFDALSINPLSLYKNFSVMSEYMTEMGRIRHSKVTGLRPVNQRKIAKAIRRAIALGLMPSVHRHPEILKLKGEPIAKPGEFPEMAKPTLLRNTEYLKRHGRLRSAIGTMAVIESTEMEFIPLTIAG